MNFRDRTTHLFYRLFSPFLISVFLLGSGALGQNSRLNSLREQAQQLVGNSDFLQVEELSREIATIAKTSFLEEYRHAIVSYWNTKEREALRNLSEADLAILKELDNGLANSGIGKGNDKQYLDFAIRKAAFCRKTLWF